MEIAYNNGTAFREIPMKEEYGLWEAQQERSRLEWSIVNAYSEAYHFNGHDSAGAKLAAQHKAAEIGALDLFRQMYRTA